MQKPEEHILSNGLPVILQHVEGTVGTLHWWNLTGSTDEQPKEAGFAHFLEHMLFKDAAAKETGQASTGQTARIIESLGGEINAYTTFDQTVYHVTCSEQYWEKVMDQFATMAKPQRFLKTDFEREREVILEELRRGEDSPDRQLYQKLFSLTYQRHPYGRPVIGFVKTLKAATVSTLEGFYRRQYVSSQMGVVVVGPIEDSTGTRKKRILSLLEKRFGSKSIPAKKTPKRTRPQEPALRKQPAFLSHGFDIKTPELAISFRIPELTHEDTAGLEVLAGILGMGESSRLYQKLFYEKALVTDASASTYVPRDSGMFLVSAELKKSSDLQSVFQCILDEISTIANHGVDQNEINRVIRNLESEKLYATQTVDGMASRLGFLRFALGDLAFDGQYLEKVKAVSSATLQRLASTYLVAERMSAVLFQPKAETLIDMEQLTLKIPRVPESCNLLQKKPTHKKRGALEPEIIRTPSGLRVAYFARPASPVYSLYLASNGGTRAEIPLDPKYWGASHLLAQTWAKGTPSKNSKQIAQITEGSAASLDGFSGRNTIGLQSSALVRDWDTLSRLFEEVAFEASFSDDELQHAKRVTQEMIRSIPDHSSQVCSKLFLENVFSEHPYGKSVLGDEAHVDRIQSSDLKKLHSRWIQPSNLSLAIVGGIHRNEVELLIERFEERFSKLQKHSLVEFERIPNPQALVAPRWAEARFDREQTHIMWGGLGISMDDPRRYALRLLQNILGGQSGRLFIELREKKSMAYSVSPMVMEGLGTGYVGTYIACAPSKTEEALRGMRTVVETLIQKGPSAAEMTRAKNYTLGQRSMDMQSSWALASHFGLELLYRNQITQEDDYRKRIESVQPKDIQRVGEALFLKQPLVQVVVS